MSDRAERDGAFRRFSFFFFLSRRFCEAGWIGFFFFFFFVTMRIAMERLEVDGWLVGWLMAVAAGAG